MSYNDDLAMADEVRHDEFEDDQDAYTWEKDMRGDDEGDWIRCSTCKGSGQVEVYGQDTDCLTCEGEGYVPAGF